MTKQFNFNSSMEEIIMTAGNQLAKMIPVSEREKEVLKKATDSLDKGAKPWQQGKNISNL